MAYSIWRNDDTGVFREETVVMYIECVILKVFRKNWRKL